MASPTASDAASSADAEPGSPPSDRGRTGGRDWGFARRPFWLFSHVFALSVVTSFLLLGLWQLDRLDQRRDTNALIEARTGAALALTEAPDGGPDGEILDYQLVDATVIFIDGDFVQIANRSQGGVAGRHVVAIAELPDGSAMAVNRGFIPANAEVELEPVPDGPVSVSGWLRATVRRGSIGAVDTGSGEVLPRLETGQVADRLGRPLPTVWLQVAPSGTTGRTTFPDPVPLPPLDEGPHFSYAVQWFIFATLGICFYGALVWRKASGSKMVTAVPEAE